MLYTNFYTNLDQQLETSSNRRSGESGLNKRFWNFQKQSETQRLGLKIRTVWVRVPPPLLNKVTDLQEKCKR